MKTKVTKIREKRWALPSEPISIHELKAGVKEAEKGPFYTIDQSKKILAGWRRKRNSPVKVSEEFIIDLDNICY